MAGQCCTVTWYYLGSVVVLHRHFVAAVLDRLHGNVSWPIAAERRELGAGLFGRRGSLLRLMAVGFVDGSIIPFKNRPSTGDRLYDEGFYNYK